LHTGNSIIIDAPRKQIFDIVSDLARWSERLPHYRSVQVVGHDGVKDLVEMSARNGRATLSWVVSCETDRDQMELRFEHLRSWSKGMTVIWTFTPTRDATRVEVTHSFKLRIPIVAWLAEPIIVGAVRAIDLQSLVEFKALIENGSGNAAA
jgi:aromatase